MVDTLDLANFLARNRQAGGVNRSLAEALSANLSPQGAIPNAPPVGAVPGFFSVRNRGPSEPGGRPRVGGGSIAGLAAVLSGGALAFPSAIAGLTLNDALGNAPSTSLFGALRSIGGRDRETGGGFREFSRGGRGRERTGPRGERGRQVE
ncbi:MAG: hypothetical protein ACR2RF_26370 [Geminicoccaceae bacterium]